LTVLNPLRYETNSSLSKKVNKWQEIWLVIIICRHFPPQKKYILGQGLGCEPKPKT